MGMWNMIKRWIPSKRKIMQLYFALLFNANLKGFVSGRLFQGKSKILCAPGINCYSCPGAIAACPLGSLQGSFSGNHSTIWYVCGILLLYSIMFGRMICGWLCPFGLIQELFYKIKTPKLKKSPVTRIFSYLKYVILVFFALIIPIMFAIRDLPLPAFCKYICPAGTIEGGLTLLANKVNSNYFSMLGPLFTWKFLLMVSIMVGCIFIFRLFCRFICPLGALYGLFNNISFFGIKLEKSKCVDCGKCFAKCKVDIKHVGDQECISCGECVDVCPTKAITWKGPKILLKANEVPEKSSKKRLLVRIISAVVMLGVLIGAIAYYWTPEDTPKPPPTTQTENENGIKEGNKVGDLCYSFELEIVNGDGPTGQKIQPNKTGKITIINFWGEWCGPCKEELPDFDRVAKEYSQDVVVIAIHSAFGKEEGPGYIKKNFPDSPILFSEDTGESGDIYSLFDGGNAYPYTIILDENGVIIKTVVSKIHYDELKAIIDEQLAK